MGGLLDLSIVVRARRVSPGRTCDGTLQLVPGIEGRTYLENGKPVTVIIQWGLKSRGESHGGPRNVMIERADGTRVVRPFRGLRRP